MKYLILQNVQVKNFSSNLSRNYLVCVLFCCIFWLIYLTYMSRFLQPHTDPNTDWIWKYKFINATVAYTIQTEGCSIPYMDPFDESVMKYYSPVVGDKKKSFECKNKDHPLIKRNRTHLLVVDDNLGLFNITDRKEFHCCSKKFYRPDSVENVWSDRIDERVNYENCVNFTKIIKIEHDFVKVICYVKDKQIYSNFYLFAANRSARLYSKQVNKTKPKYNVLVLGIDNMSRLNFHRTMPKTLKFLQSLDAVELEGYTKVGSNSYPNIIAMLTGLRAYGELDKVCYPHEHATFDFCPFAWTWYKKEGYYTALGEDTNPMGTFTYLANGFIRSPTDFYMHPFTTEARDTKGLTQICVGEKYYFEVLLEYVEDILYVVESVKSKLFGFFWSVSLSHEDLNTPMLMDDTFYNFFKRMNESDYLKTTIFLLISDHGMRHGGIRRTKQGRLEERLPFISILTPPSFAKNHSQALKNLKINSKRLTSPYDVYETLIDILHSNNIENDMIQNRTDYNKKRGVSLFLPISQNRTCRDAGIDDYWCTCIKEKKLSKQTKEADSAADFLIKKLNEIVRPYPECAQLKLDKIMEATEQVPGIPEKGEGGWRELLVVIQTSPGYGVFEGLLRQDGKRWTLAGEISRINRYGEQSRCVFHPSLRLYCYCK